MMKYILLLAALWGGWYYASRHVNLDDTLKYVHQNAGASWAPRANYTIAVMYHQREDYPRSQAAFSQLLTDFSTSTLVANSLVYLEEAAEANRDWDTAKTALARYIDEFPEGPKIDLMRKRQELMHYHHGR